MVLETIDAINSELSTINGPKQACSPLSVSTQGSGTPKHAIASPIAQESRDAAVATPCDSIRMYANELAPSKSASATSSGNPTPCDSIRDTPCDSIRDYANELTASKSGSGSGIGEHALAPKAILVPAATEASAAVPLADVPAADPLARTTSARSELSQGSGAARPTLITVTSSDERKLEMNENNQCDGEELHPSDSVEVVAMREEEVPTEGEADAEAKPEAIEEEPVEEDSQIEAAKEKPVEEETTLVEDEAKPEEEIAAAESAVKASVSIEEQGQPGQKEVEKEEEESQPATDADVETPTSSENETGKKKKFGLRFSKKPAISKPNISVRSPRGAMSLTKGLPKPDLSKPNLSKPNLPKPGISKPQRSMRFTKSSRGKKSKNKADSPVPAPQAEPKTTAPPENVSAPEEPRETTEEPKETTAVAKEEPTSPAEMETIDLNDDCKNAETPSSPPAVETKQSCSAFFVEQNTTMQVNEAEMLDATKEENDDEVSLPEVQVTPQVTELVTKAPETEAAEAAEATAAVNSEASFEGGECGQNIIEVLYNKAEECFGDVTNLCGPKSKSKKADKVKKSPSNDDGTVTEEAEADKPLGDATDDTKEATTTTTTPAPDASQDSKPAELMKPAETPFPELMTPLSVATERARSFVEDIVENPSIKSLVESVSSVARQAEDTLFPTTDAGSKISHSSTTKVDLAPNAAPSAEKAEQDKLDKAAEMAKKALDEGAGAADDNNSEGTSEEKTSKSATAPKSKRFGLTGKSQLKIFAPKPPAAAPKSAQAEKTPAVPTSPSKLFSIKRGFSTRTRSGAGKTKLEAGSAAGKSASNSKKPAPSRFLRFKKPAGLVARRKSNNKALSPKSEAEAKAVSILSQEEVQEDLEESTSMNSQSLNEPQTSIVEETVPVPEGEEKPKVEETPKQEESRAVDEKPSVAEEPVALAVDEPVDNTSEPAVATEELKTQEPMANASEPASERADAAEELETQTHVDEETKVQETPTIDEPKTETQQQSKSEEERTPLIQVEEQSS